MLHYILKSMIQRLDLWIDKSAIGLSGLCLLHCLLTTFALLALSAGSIGFFQHSIHQIGLAVAIPLAVVGLGRGVLQHGRWQAAAAGGVGIGLMLGALLTPHGHGELSLTVAGVVLVGVAHYFNIRWSHV
jgi:hypothetical protein